MATTEQDRQHWKALGTVVRARREHLGLRQQDLEPRGGPGEFTVRNVENQARDKYTPRTYARLEAALRFPEGSLQRVLSGELSPDDLQVSNEGVEPYGEGRLRQHYRDHPPEAHNGRQGMVDRARPAGDPADPAKRIRGATGALARAVDTLTRNPNPSDVEEMALAHVMDALGQLRAPVEWDEEGQRYLVIDRG